jgi:hypothetical protein
MIHETQIGFSMQETSDRKAIQLLSEVASERIRQDETWGGAVHDDGHSTAEFAAYITDYAGRAGTAAMQDDVVLARKRLIQVAALAVAGVESIDRQRKPSSVDDTSDADNLRNDYARMDASYKSLIIALAPSLSVEQLRLVGAHTGAWFVFVESPPYYLIRAGD